MNKQIRRINRYKPSGGRACALLAGAALLVAPIAFAQDDEGDEEIFELSPFTVQGSDDEGYRATSTLAGTRIRTDLRDVGSAISVYTEEILQDTGATDNESLLVYTTSTEVGGPQGNFAGVGTGSTPTENFATPSQNTRVRGLAAADNTRNYFLSDVPWDGYNVNRVDMQRGPNAILFGLGSPAGIINTTTDAAIFADDNEINIRFGSHGSTRLSLNANRVVVDDVFAVRVAALMDHENFRQDPAFEDDERLFIAARYDPQFGQSDSMTTSLQGSFESGSIRSNRPRTLPPIDRITPFFRPVGRETTYDEAGVPISNSFPLYGGIGGQTFHPLEVEDSLYGDAANRATRPWPPGAEETVQAPNPDFVPALGNYSQVFASPLMVFPGPDSQFPSFTMVHEPKQFLSYDNSVYAPYRRLGSVGLYTDYVRETNQPLADTGTYRNIHLKDASVFDFYNHLIDGPNKEEWNDFNSLNLNFSQTFLEGNLGYELAYFDESVNRGNVASMDNGGNTAIFIDTNSHLGDGSVNPNAGRPFISDSLNTGNSERWIERDSFRATVYGEYDFNDRGTDSWLNRLLGRHRATGLYAEDSREQDVRTFLPYKIVSDEFRNLQLSGGAASNAIDSNEFLVNFTTYLGPSLLGQDSASGAYIANPSVRQMPTSGMVRLFDHRWTAPAGVDPEALWIDPLGEESIQGSNPANYAGWTEVPIEIVSWDQTPTARLDYGMYTGNGSSLTRSEVDSEALVWQGFFWDGSVVGTYGWRRDVSRGWAYNGNADNPTPVTEIYDPFHPSANLDLYEPDMQEGQSQSWSVAAHLNQLLGDRLPLNISLYYNESENFQPGAGRVDIYGDPIPSPAGTTEDASILFATKDNRYSLKITKYETRVTNSNSPYLEGTWFMGNLVTWGTEWANIAEYNIKSGRTLADVATPEEVAEQRAAGGFNQWNYEDAEIEANAIAAWRDFTAAIPQEWLSAWGIDGDLNSDVQAFGTNQGPANLSYTQDAISEGYEFELVAQPTENWRILLNASKTSAQRNNVGGESFKEWVDFVDSWILDTDAGDIRVWWGDPVNEISSMWVNNFRSNFSLLELLEGSDNPEIREWAFNVITNYDFTDGVFSGVNVGGGLRWQDEIVIGYPIGEGAEGRPTFDLANPYLGPSEEAVDLWIGYGLALSDNIDWRIQLNVRDAFGKTELIPIATQPNGDIATARINSGATWQLTNTFSF